MGGFNTLVVSLACAESDASLIAWAGLLARMGQAKEVRFVHIVRKPADRAAALSAIRTETRKHFGASSAEVQCDILQGPVTDRLLQYASEIGADFIVVGGERHILSARLAMVASCSIAMVPAGHPARISNILSPIDFSRHSADVIESAAELASGGEGVVCTALHVITHESVDLFAESDAELAAERAEAMRKFLWPLNRRGVPVVSALSVVGAGPGLPDKNVRFSLPSAIESSQVAAEIVREATKQGADCIAISTRGRSASASILLGSVAQEVLRQAEVPLLVFKHFGARVGLSDLLLGRAGSGAEIKFN